MVTSFYQKRASWVTFYCSTSFYNLPKEIKTNFGETLSWDYLCYARTHPICWQVPTKIAYGEKDHLTTHETMHRFAEENKCTLSVMDDGEHWFRTEEQMAFLDAWLRDE